MPTYLDPGDAVDLDVRESCLEVIAEFPAIPNVWGYATSPDHNNRRCVDYMVIGQGSDTARVKLGDAIAAYHVRNAKRLGVNGIIWNRRVMGLPHEGGQGSYAGPYATWRTYYGPKSHTDHVHVEYDGSDYADNISFTWDGHSFPGEDKFRLGVDGDWITWVGQRLVVHGFTGYTVGPGPNFSPTDLAGVAWFQARAGLKPSGIPDAETWAQLAADPNDPTPEPAVPHTTFHALSFNVQGGQRSTFAGRVPAIVKVITGNPCSVVMLQECDDGQAAQIQDQLGADWMWRNELDNTVLYRKSIWGEASKKFVYDLPNPHSPGYPRNVLVVGLTHGKTGELIWAASTHFTANGYPKTMTGEQGAEERSAQAVAAAAALADYRWVVLGGDLNSSSTAAARPQGILNGLGWSSLRDRADVEGRDKASFDSADQPVWIDYVGIKAGLGYYKGGKLVPTGSASDHNALYAAIWIRKRDEVA